MPSSYSIGDHFDGFIRAQIASGRYASASEVIREALRLLEEHQQVRLVQLEELRELIRTGSQSGPGVEASRVFAKLRKQIATARKERSAAH